MVNGQRFGVFSRLADINDATSLGQDFAMRLNPLRFQLLTYFSRREKSRISDKNESFPGVSKTQTFKTPEYIVNLGAGLNMGLMNGVGPLGINLQAKLEKERRLASGNRVRPMVPTSLWPGSWITIYNFLVC